VEAEATMERDGVNKLLPSIEPQYAIPSGMKHKLPAQKYLEEPEEKEEIKIKRISDPVNSPLYSLLLSYEAFKEKKSDTKILMQGLLEGEEELNYLIDKIETSPDQNNRDEMEDMSDFITEALSILEELQSECMEEAEEDTVELIYEYIGNLRKLNLNIYKLNEKIFKVKVGLSINDSIKDTLSRFTDEDYKTANYIVLEKGVNDFLSGNIEKDQLAYLVVNMRDVISNAQDQYETLPVSEDELTLEVLRGDKLLNEGFMGWLYGLELMEEGLEEKDEETLQEGLDYIFSGNKKLVLVQYFSDQVQKQTERQEALTDKWSR